MSQTKPERNKALVLEAFDTLFNKRDYVAAERYWSSAYIQHSARIRTVINLRGCCAPMDWYLGEYQVTHRLNVSLEDVSMSASRLPSPSGEVPAGSVSSI